MQLQTMYPSQNNSPHAETSAVITAAETQIEVNDATILPDAPNVLTLGTEEDAELVLMTAKTENILVVTRGYNGTTAKAWDAGTWIYRGISTDDLDALQNNIEALNEGKLESVGTDDVNDEAITNAKLATMATGTIKGNAAAEAAAPADLSAADVRRLLNVADGADVTATEIAGASAADAMGDSDTIPIMSGDEIKRVTPSVLKSALGSDLPAGGDAGQALIKSSAEDYDAAWQDISAGAEQHYATLAVASWYQQDADEDDEYWYACDVALADYDSDTQDILVYAADSASFDWLSENAYYELSVTSSAFAVQAKEIPTVAINVFYMIVTRSD